MEHALNGATIGREATHARVKVATCWMKTRKLAEQRKV